MDQPTKTFQGMPAILMVLFWISLCLPVFSAFLLQNPIDFINSGQPLKGTLSVATLYIFPCMVALTIIKRHFTFLFFAAFEAIGLILLTILDNDAVPADWQAVRYSLIALMAGIGIFVLNRDILYPFVAGKVRLWRRNPRLFANLKMSLKDAKTPVAIPLIMENCSLTGTAAMGNRDQLKKFLSNKSVGQPVAITVQYARRSFDIPANIVWYRYDGPVCTLGFACSDVEKMALLIQELKLRKFSQGRLANSVARIWLFSPVRKIFLSLWCLSILGSFMLPACSPHQGKHRAMTDSEFGP
jgi:hypothetical protein